MFHNTLLYQHIWGFEGLNFFIFLPTPIFSIICIMAILSYDESKSICFLLLCLCSMWNWLICMAWYKYDFFQYWDLIVLVIVQLLNLVFKIPWTSACQASLSFSISQRLIKLMSIELVMPSKHLVLWFLLPSIFPSIRVFSNESALCIRWLKYWSFSFSISPSNEYLRLISFSIDWFDLLAVQGTLKSLPTPQFESISSSVLSLLYGPTLTCIHDYWKNFSFD